VTKSNKFGVAAMKIAAYACLFLAMGGVDTVAAHAGQVKPVRIGTSCLIVHSAPKKSSRRIECIDAGKVAQSSGQRSGSWIKVTYKGKTGWVGQRLARYTPAASPAKAPANAPAKVQAEAPAKDKKTTPVGLAALDQLEETNADASPAIETTAAAQTSVTTEEDTTPAEASATAEASPIESQTVKITGVENCLNMHAKAAKTKHPPACIPLHAEVEATGRTENGFREVTYKKKLGWISEDNSVAVDDTDVPDSAPVSSSTAAQTVKTNVAQSRPAEKQVKEELTAKGRIRNVYARTAEQSCAFLTDARQNLNCMAIFKQLNFLDKDAIRYALGYLEENADGIQDRSCGARSRKKAGLPREFKNKCSFVVNDIERKFAGILPLRSRAVYIDLCAKDVHHVVRDFLAKKGTGPLYWDQLDMKTTVAGAFVTSGHTRKFTPYCKKNKKTKKCTINPRYTRLERELGGRIPGLDITPLHSTNNDSLRDKPIHVSPFQSSHGCPSVDKKDRDILEKLGANGPSLWINYGLKALHPTESIYKCDAVPEDATKTVKAINNIRATGKVKLNYNASGTAK
jgi:uncharacterized protein YgiM (DUF1202 family)